MNSDEIVHDIQDCLVLPKEILNFQRNEITNDYSIKIRSGLVDDVSMLSCGCCTSEKLYTKLLGLMGDGCVRCPSCQSGNVSMVGAVKPLRSIFTLLQLYQRTYKESDNEIELFANSDKYSADDSATTTTHRSLLISQDASLTSKQVEKTPSQYKSNRSEYFGRSLGKPYSLLSLFHAVATKVNSESAGTKSHSDSINQPQASLSFEDNDNELSSTDDLKVLDNASNTRTVPISQGSVIESIKSDPQNLTVSVSTNEEKEYYFAKCFPVYRRRTQFNTHQKFLKTKSKLFVNMSISPDCTKFALITEHKWEVYGISNDLSKQHAVLLFCGKSTGEYGPDFDNLQYPTDKDVLTPKGKKVQNDSWEHYYCKLSNDLLVISGTKRKLRIFDLNQGGQPIYTYFSSFPIRCIDIDSNSNLLACGVTGKDRNTGSEQALIVFHRITRNKVTSEPEFLSPFTITLPYRDPINTLQFSSDGLYLSCSTALESRFLVISLRKVNEPRLVMKSLRSIDTSMESEGITDTKLFPGNPNLMCVTSTAFNAPPIVINTKIQNTEGLQSVAQPTMLIRLDELGSKIYKCEVSPRNDSIAFLERNGSVCIMFAPTMMDNEKKRIVLVDMVANASRAKESAALRFSPDGHKLLILDRKGILYIEDFSHGLPQGHEVTKCKQIN